jgi:hypothetical protein
MKHHLLLLLVILTCSFFAPTHAQTPRYARVISANANLRDTPSVSGVSEQEVAEDTIVKVLDEKLPWYVVRVGNRVGWMHGNTLEFIGTTGHPTTEPRYRSSTPSIPRSEKSQEITPRSTTVDRGYIRGPRGGCYYLSGSGRKVYVDRDLCN